MKFVAPFAGAFLILWGVGLYIQSIHGALSGWWRTGFGAVALAVVAGGLVVGT